MIVEVINQPDIDAVWAVFAADVVKCLAKTPSIGMAAGDYYTLCRSGTAFLIAVHDGSKFVALSVWRYEGDAFVCLLLVGKDMGLWIGKLLEKSAAVSIGGGGSGRLLFEGRTGLAGMFRRYYPSVRIVRHTYEVTP